MNIPERFSLETELLRYSNQTEWILGADEVGRGAFAGPIVAACCAVPRAGPYHPDVRDSKALSAKVRRELFRWILRNHKVLIRSRSSSEIDRWGVGICNQMILQEAVMECQARLPSAESCFVFIDGNLRLRFPKELQIECVVKGDQKSYAIACASIVAKHIRDYYMRRMSRWLGQYGFDQNNGYGTSDHIQAIKTYGLSAIHRKSFCQNIFLLRELPFPT